MLEVTVVISQHHNNNPDSWGQQGDQRVFEQCTSWIHHWVYHCPSPEHKVFILKIILVFPSALGAESTYLFMDLGDRSFSTSFAEVL